jgi:hypothetical protein
MEGFLYPAPKVRGDLVVSTIIFSPGFPLAHINKKAVGKASLFQLSLLLTGFPFSHIYGKHQSCNFVFYTGFSFSHINKREVGKA